MQVIKRYARVGGDVLGGTKSTQETNSCSISSCYWLARVLRSIASLPNHPPEESPFFRTDESEELPYCCYCIAIYGPNVADTDRRVM